MVLLILVTFIFLFFNNYINHLSFNNVKINFVDYKNEIKNINFDKKNEFKISRCNKHLYSSYYFQSNGIKYKFSFFDYILVRLYLKFKKNRNILGFIEKNDRQLIIMRALPGAGKSTEAKKLVGNGIILSTDDIMFQIGDGDYNKAFSMELNGRPAIGVAHRRNYFKAIESMKKGITPVIIDNTNLKRKDIKTYAKEALKLGYKDENIIIVNLGLNGCTIDELVSRNTHGVDQETMENMYHNFVMNNPVSINQLFKNK